MDQKAIDAESSPSETGLVTVEDERPATLETKPVSPPIPPQTPPPAPPQAAPGPSFGERLGRFFRFLLRVVFLLIILSFLSLMLYLLLPWFYQTFIRPVQQNTVQIQELQAQQKQMEQEIADLQTRLDTLESAQTGHDGNLADLATQVNGVATESSTRIQTLTVLEEMQSELRAQNQANAAELDVQIHLLKAMELLSRARMSMYQSNFGLARQDVQIARDLLASVRPDAPDVIARELDAVIPRLDLALSNLPDFPVPASDDLDIAWQILLSGLPPVTPVVSETPTPMATVSATPTGFATLTPTPRATVTGFPTP